MDATVGHGGHSKILGRSLNEQGIILGLDVDHHCLATARSVLQSLRCRVVLERENFARLDEVMKRNRIRGADLIVADLGWCSAQMEDPKRGMSFQRNMPLDMRLDERLERTAADWVNETDETKLANVIYAYGEERASRRIARAIVEYRHGQKITTTAQLANLICREMGRGWSGKPGQIHPATRTFQALRIVVNDEMGCLERLLESAPGLLNPDGILAIISFHSLEDRRVKQDFLRRKSEGIYEILTDKPMVAQEDEVRRNIRSRSAKLRMARRMRCGKTKEFQG